MLFLTRRIWIAVLTVQLQWFPVAQVAGYTFSSLFVASYNLGVRPYANNSLMWLENLNEAAVLYSCHFMLLYTGAIQNRESLKVAGEIGFYGIIALLGLNVFAIAVSAI